jgi:hypothetical protein
VQERRIDPLNVDAPVLNGLDRVGDLNDLEGGFFVIGKPPAAI